MNKSFQMSVQFIEDKHLTDVKQGSVSLYCIYSKYCILMLYLKLKTMVCDVLDEFSKKKKTPKNNLQVFVSLQKQ